MWTIYIQIGLLVASSIAATLAILSYLRIHRHRVIYSIKRYSLRLPSFEPHNTGDSEEKLEEINKDLVSCKYTILQMVALSEYYVDVYLGRVKKR